LSNREQNCCLVSSQRCDTWVVPLECGISVADCTCGKLNQRMFRVWVIITIFLRNSFGSPSSTRRRAPKSRPWSHPVLP
jgi:hypothetical protein